MAIQVLKPKFHVDECLDSIKECLEMGWTGMGFKTVQLEEKWKGLNASVFCTSERRAERVKS